VIAVIAVEEDNYIVGGNLRQAAEAGGSVTPLWFHHYPCSVLPGDFRCPIGGAIIHDEDLVHTLRQLDQHRRQGALFVQRRDDHSDCHACDTHGRSLASIISRQSPQANGRLAVAHVA
jgi:hypothetical protein